MKIAITGHTSGIGKALYTLYENAGHEVIGFSRSNGFDITKPDQFSKIVKQVIDCDVFFNNAYAAFIQVEFLYSLHPHWVNEMSKTHVVISSNSGDGIKKTPHPYAIHKAAIDKTAEQLNQSARYRLINIRPGYVDTPRVKRVVEPKINVDDLAETIRFIVQEKSIFVPSITILPPK
jgi:NADP-dependent 3-hydroxy acid dehydrogenase YdfG